MLDRKEYMKEFNKKYRQTKKYKVLRKGYRQNYPIKIEGVEASEDLKVANN